MASISDLKPIRTDTWVDAANPTTNYSTRRGLSVALDAALIYLWAKRPDPGVTVLSAILRLYAKGVGPSGSVTLTVRRVDVAWNVATVNWNNRPTTAPANAAAVTKSSSPEGTEWAFDLTTMWQAIADGSLYFGLRVESSVAGVRPLFPSEVVEFTPTLELVTSTRPDAPTILSPSGGRSVSLAKPTVRFDFTDEIGSTLLQAVQVQVDPAGDFVDPLFDSGTVLTDTPGLDLNTFASSRAAAVTITSASTAITSTTAVFVRSDIGQSITGTGIPTGATIASVTSTTAATLSVAATATNSVTKTINRIYLGLVNAAETRWRVRVQDAAGLWSLYSDVQRFRRTDKAIVTITNPAVAPNNFVSEFTPPLAATSSTTLTGWRIILAKVADPTNIRYDTGRVAATGTSIAHTPPSGVLIDNHNYRLTVRAYDAVDRERTPGDAPWAEATRDFTVNESATVATVTTLAASAVTPYPWAQLTFNRSTAPDSFNVLRDGEVIASGLIAADLLVSGTQYRYEDRTAAASRSHVWSVQAVVNRVVSASNPTVTYTIPSYGVWLMDNERNVQVFIAPAPGSRDAGTWGMGEEGTTFTPLGAPHSVRITASLRGWEGNVSGVLLDMHGVDALTWQARLLRLRNRPGQELMLHAGSEAFRVVVANIVTGPTAVPPTTKAVAFDFWQV